MKTTNSVFDCEAMLAKGRENESLVQDVAETNAEFLHEAHDIFDELKEFDPNESGSWQAIMAIVLKIGVTKETLMVRMQISEYMMDGFINGNDWPDPEIAQDVYDDFVRAAEDRLFELSNVCEAMASGKYPEPKEP